MSQKDKFTFRQALINVIIAYTVVIGLSLSNGTSFYKRPENVGVIILVILAGVVALYVKWKKEKG